MAKSSDGEVLPDLHQTFSLWDVFRAGRFSIPRFQRPYEWEAVHVHEFVHDLRRAHVQSGGDAPPPRKDYFLGLVTLAKHEGYEVIDGQQRLTTAMLMSSMLRLRMAELQLTKSHKELYERLQKVALRKYSKKTGKSELRFERVGAGRDLDGDYTAGLRSIVLPSYLRRCRQWARAAGDDPKREELLAKWLGRHDKGYARRFLEAACRILEALDDAVDSALEEDDDDDGEGGGGGGSAVGGGGGDVGVDSAEAPRRVIVALAEGLLDRTRLCVTCLPAEEADLDFQALNTRGLSLGVIAVGRAELLRRLNGDPSCDPHQFESHVNRFDDMVDRLYRVGRGREGAIELFEYALRYCRATTALADGSWAATKRSVDEVKQILSTPVTVARLINICSDVAPLQLCDLLDCCVRGVEMLSLPPTDGNPRSWPSSLPLRDRNLFFVLREAHGALLKPWHLVIFAIFCNPLTPMLDDDEDADPLIRQSSAVPAASCGAAAAGTVEEASFLTSSFLLRLLEALMLHAVAEGRHMGRVVRLAHILFRGTRQWHDLSSSPSDPSVAGSADAVACLHDAMVESSSCSTDVACRRERRLVQRQVLENVLQLLPSEWWSVVDEALDGEIYRNRKLSRHALLRLEAHKSQEGFLQRAAQGLTLEHILPQTLTQQWRQAGWDAKRHREAKHRLGNMAPLEGWRNSAAGNKDSSAKVAVYHGNDQRPDARCTPFLLTNELQGLLEGGFTPSMFRDRHRDLRQRLSSLLGSFDSETLPAAFQFLSVAAPQPQETPPDCTAGGIAAVPPPPKDDDGEGGAAAGGTVTGAPDGAASLQPLQEDEEVTGQELAKRVLEVKQQGDWSWNQAVRELNIINVSRKQVYSGNHLGKFCSDPSSASVPMCRAVALGLTAFHRKRDATSPSILYDVASK